MDQFGMISLLNLPNQNYALKTGTSVDYKDSLIVGYTPDFVVAVWVGNADNSATEGLSGQQGAGLIWSSIMEIMLNSEYNKNTQFDFTHIKSFDTENGLEWGLLETIFNKAQNILKELDNSLITNPHDNDVFLFDKNSEIKLSANDECEWFINDEPFTDLFFKQQVKAHIKLKLKIKIRKKQYIFTLNNILTSNCSL
jgi:membrane carboxypeptidase/penicillin-binding protein PbpC